MDSTCTTVKGRNDSFQGLRQKCVTDLWSLEGTDVLMVNFNYCGRGRKWCHENPKDTRLPEKGAF